MKYNTRCLNYKFDFLKKSKIQNEIFSILCHNYDISLFYEYLIARETSRSFTLGRM